MGNKCQISAQDLSVEDDGQDILDMAGIHIFGFSDSAVLIQEVESSCSNSVNAVLSVLKVALTDTGNELEEFFAAPFVLLRAR